jgi:hypothetical protein
MLNLTITATTSDAAIADAIRYNDMRTAAIIMRDMAAAVMTEQGDQITMELYDVDGIDVLFSPVFGFAWVNQPSAGIGHSLMVEYADTPEDAAAEWRCE